MNTTETMNDADENMNDSEQELSTEVVGKALRDPKKIPEPDEPVEKATIERWELLRNEDGSFYLEGEMDLPHASGRMVTGPLRLFDAANNKAIDPQMVYTLGAPLNAPSK